MRLGLFIGASAILLSAASFHGSARADDEAKVDVSASGNTVTAKTYGAWHVNPEYPWKIKGAKDDNKSFKQTGFSFNGQTATIANIPKGEYTVSGGVCTDGDKKQCSTFTKNVTVK